MFAVAPKICRNVKTSINHFAYGARAKCNKMRQELTKVFQDVADGKLTPDEAYYKFIDMKQDLYSVLAKECGLVEIGPNKWVKKGEEISKDSLFEKWWYLSKNGFHLHLEEKQTPQRSFFSFLFGGRR